MKDIYDSRRLISRQIIFYNVAVATVFDKKDRIMSCHVLYVDVVVQFMYR